MPFTTPSPFRSGERLAGPLESAMTLPENEAPVVGAPSAMCAPLVATAEPNPLVGGPITIACCTAAPVPESIEYTATAPSARSSVPFAVPTTSVPRRSETVVPNPAHSPGNGEATSLRNVYGGAASKMRTRPSSHA